MKEKKLVLDKMYWYGQLADWTPRLKPIIKTPYMVKLINFLLQEYEKEEVHPTFNKIFRAFDLSSFEKLRVVILGLEPSTLTAAGGPIANGVAYSNDIDSPNPFGGPIDKISVCVEQKLYKGLNLDFNPNLKGWMNQGVLLLNVCPTAVKGKPMSHERPWKKFISYVFELINKEHDGIIFCLWGKELEHYRDLIDEKKHIVLVNETSPRDAVKRGDNWQCDHFGQINKILLNNKQPKIKW